MANEFYTPAQAATVAMNLVAEDGVLSALVSANYRDEILGAGRGGAPVAIKQPTTLIARERDIDDTTTKIVLDEIAESVVTFNLSRKMDYHAAPLTEGDLNLRITDFSAQVLKPQAEAIVDSLEHKVATTLMGVPVTTLGVTYDPANPVPYFTRLRKSLRDNGVPTSGINVAVGTEVFAALLDAKALMDVSESGSTLALREAQIGRLRGLTIVESTRVAEDEVLAWHTDAVTLITRAPAVPQGAKFGAQIAEKGVSLRYLRDYDADFTVDRSILATFSAVGILPTYKITRDYDTRTVVKTALPNGGVLHLDTAAV